MKCRNLKYLSLTVCWLLLVKCAISRVGYTAGQNGVLRYKEHNQREREEWGDRESGGGGGGETESGGRGREGETDRQRQTDRDREIDRHTETDKQTDRETGRETERERVNIVYANNNKIQLH